MKETIRKIEAFSGLDEKLLSKIAATAITCSYGADETIIREGEVGIGMYFILRGRVGVFRNYSGSDVRLGEIGANEFVAEMALIDEKPRSASVVTLEETECVLFTRDTVRHLLEKYPSLSIRLVRVMAERLRAAQDQPRTAAAQPAAVAASGASGASGEDTAAADAQAASMKNAIEKKMLDMFEMLYTAKAFTRFSVAILGCPVEGSGADALEVIRVGDVKAVLLPASGPVELEIGAYGAGQFQLHVFHPAMFGDSGPRALRFAPEPIQPDDRFTLSLPDAVLTRHARPDASGGQVLPVAEVLA